MNKIKTLQAQYHFSAISKYQKTSICTSIRSTNERPCKTCCLRSIKLHLGGHCFNQIQEHSAWDFRLYKTICQLQTNWMVLSWLKEMVNYSWMLHGKGFKTSKSSNYFYRSINIQKKTSASNVSNPTQMQIELLWT